MKTWITRDCNGLFLHYNYPRHCFYYDKEWWDSGDCKMQLDDTDFPEVTFENSPMEVELVLKK